MSYVIRQDRHLSPPTYLQISDNYEGLLYKWVEILEDALWLTRKADAERLCVDGDNYDLHIVTVDEERERLRLQNVPPVDRTQQCTTSGRTPDEVRKSQIEDGNAGQHKDYIVLCEGERKKGFVRPYRDAYRHLECGSITTMSREIAETYARDPGFYGSTFCIKCNAHFPVGENGEFTWYEMDGAEGPKVGT